MEKLHDRSFEKTDHCPKWAFFLTSGPKYRDQFYGFFGRFWMKYAVLIGQT